ncbi:hypothetical protein OG585_33135 [Streptomyces sp. NBC_01340]|uniref:hypothetical protein n=1 Tax=unclassified Streptomyces TaxID=2593676 RepID=UPI00224EF36D|nr:MULTISPECIES: hypothetical protein [unclassified Streptomyces]MCX4457426.1 hypothetical protein [Streptomyces sp. NBC_01719]MCX4496783.1 hypothetical protein [Streptomyces sp. NBC_01728]WSI41667.1 hypothetical protein OG585_33135 [Streptomyces sp. NBC_01340]
MRIAGPGSHSGIRDERVECREFLVVVIACNGEREFPAAFRRRCLTLEMRTPSREQLLAMVEGHLWIRPLGTEELVDVFVRRMQAGGTHSADEVPNAVKMTTLGVFRAEGDGLGSWKCSYAISRRAAE